MEQKNRLVFTIAVILLIFSALLVSFGRILFQLDTPEVALPSVDLSQSGDGPGNQHDPAGAEQTVSVTPQTVQSVIATLARTDSYYRELTIEQFWPGGSSTSTVQTWVDQQLCHSYQRLPNGAGRHDFIAGDTLYYWYDGSSLFESAPADEYSADLAQRLPTYETVLELDSAAITDAGYELKNALPCIYVEAAGEDDSSLSRYWVSVDSGLLVCAELSREGEVFYRVTAADTMQSPCPVSAPFQLPDGTAPDTP
ncbi:MAG: hypothetical protein IJZ52_05630 [Clostridium sp.]|nr:hypothetical protein [Clostridium sp.]